MVIDFELISRALSHYAKKFQELQDDDEIKLGNGFVKRDLENNSKNALKLAKEIIKVKHINILKDYSALVESSMQVYLKDLKKSKEKLIEKLQESEMKAFSLDEINEEIGKIEKYLD